MIHSNASTFKGLDLVAMARRGDRVAFDELAARHHRRNISIAHGILRDHVEAHDQVQESYRRAFESLDQFHGNTDEFSEWLSRIVEDTCVIRMRSLRRARFPDIDQGNTFKPERNLIKGQLATAVRRLPRILREAILHDVSELR